MEFNPDDIKDLYNEKEFRIEDQDLRMLKAITSDDIAAREFVNTYDKTLFVGDARNFADKAIGYYKAYGALPTKRVMLDDIVDNPLKEEIEFIWERLDSIQYHPSEFRWDLDKIKDRFTKNTVVNIKQGIEELDLENVNYEKVLNDIRLRIDNTEKIRKGKESIYIQKTLREYMPEFREDFIRKIKDPTLGQGTLTQYSYIDYITNGLAPSDMLIIGAETGGGKMLPLNTLIPTPNGFKEMRNIKVGDIIFGRDGKQYKVLAESPVVTAPGWKFIFNDNSEIISHDDHLWLSFDRKEQVGLTKYTDEWRAKERKYKNDRKVKKTKNQWLVNANKSRKYKVKLPSGGTIRSTSEIVNKLFVNKNNRRNFAIPIAQPLELPVQNLLLDPYIFGLWLGDGSKNDGAVTTADQEVVDYIEKAGFLCRRAAVKKLNDGTISKAKTYYFDNLRLVLKQLTVLNDKHIPNEYLWSSKEQRLSLLQGIMDSDGFADRRGKVDFVNTNKRIIDGVKFLIESLGEKCTVTPGLSKLYGVVKNNKWTIRFSPSFNCFRLLRKLERQNRCYNRFNKLRYIKNAVRTPATPMKCIQVSSPDNLYLAGSQMVPTHNSMLLNNMAIQMWLQGTELGNPLEMKGNNIQYFSLEMPYEQCFRRTMSRLSQVPTYSLRDCQITDDVQLKSLSDAAKFIHNFGFDFEIVDLARGATIKAIEDRYLEAVARGRAPKIVVVDYLGLMEVDSLQHLDDWLKLGFIAGQLHEFARTYNVIVLTAVQLNRPPGKKPHEIIGLHRIGRSSLIMHHATVGVQIETRPDEETYSDLAYHIIKNRNGECGSNLLKKDFRRATLIDREIFKPMYEDNKIDLIRPTMEDISGRLEEYGWN